jgi:hypothetical protein
MWLYNTASSAYNSVYYYLWPQTAPAQPVQPPTQVELPRVPSVKAPPVPASPVADVFDGVEEAKTPSSVRTEEGSFSSSPLLNAEGLFERLQAKGSENLLENVHGLSDHNIRSVSAHMHSRLEVGTYDVPMLFNTPAHVTIAPGTTVAVDAQATRNPTDGVLSIQPFMLRFSSPIAISNPASSLKPLSGRLGAFLNNLGDRCATAFITAMGFDGQGQFQASGYLKIWGCIPLPLGWFFDPGMYPQIFMDDTHLKEGAFIARPAPNNRQVDTERLLAVLWRMTPKSDLSVTADGAIERDAHMVSPLGRTDIPEGPIHMELQASVSLRPDHTAKVKLYPSENRAKPPRHLVLTTPAAHLRATASVTAQLPPGQTVPTSATGHAHVDVPFLNVSTSLMSDGRPKGTAHTSVPSQEAGSSERAPVHSDIMWTYATHNLQYQADTHIDALHALKLPVMSWFGVSVDPSHTSRTTLDIHTENNHSTIKQTSQSS